jgi:hypothetical protein
MLQKTRTFAMSLAVLFLLGAVAPAPVNAWPLGKALHLHPRAPQQQDTRITVYLFNKAERFQEVSVAGHVYTVMPHYSLTIKAPAGTDVFAGTSTVSHHKGDLLFSVSPEHSFKTITIN